MDNFLEELKRDQKVREDRLKHQAGRVGSSVTALAAREHAPVLTGSYDSGDPLTTNIHVAGLPQHVTEQSLGMFFAQYGPVGSVKIMWPRADSIPVGGRRLLGGFVAFLRRPDAEKAAKELDGAEWGGNILRTGWGKAVPLPARPIYEIEGASSRSDRDRERRPHHGRSSSRDRDRSCRYSSSGSRSRSRSPPRRQWPELEAGVDDKFLRSVSARVREHGSGFEEMIRVKERENPKFGFLFDEKLPSYHYFKMLLDSRYRPPSTVSFVDEGNADIYSSDSAEDSERERTPKGRLGKLAQKRFESMLRSLTSTREKIGRSMAFALEHADAASLIVDLLVASLTLDGTPVPRKIARLHLVSDILHNSSASLPNAWVYRSIFENRLPEVFDHLGDVYLSFPGRMKAEQFRNQVVDIVDVWERDWILFEPSVIEDFRQRLSGVSAATEGDPSLDAEMASLPPSTLDASAPSFAPSFAPAEPEPAVPVPAPEAPPAKRGFKIGGFKTTFQPSALDAQLPDEAEDVDGAPVEDVDGAPVEDVDGEEVDVDGEAVDVDGEVLLEDVDGAPVVQEKGKTETVVIEDDEAMDLAQSDDDIF
ncbi:hypothetical protein BCR35DRAFT_157196 [Leucosporidium creatinivorum]|uniref:CID domain-containing protein n=1 Tax=Leucosporidium creatinivorum TaxID=106004 RepID=A0A1Y2FZS1_9BASI|nr:hypothetical protein BCR35DRAFT_157196 [Leucosporidium creatinivorum]